VAEPSIPQRTDIARRFGVGVIVARRRLRGPWSGEIWLARAVLPATPATAPGTPLGSGDDEDLFYAGPAEIALHASATAHYRDNLSAARPSLWVALRPAGADAVAVVAVTADPYEGEAMAEAFGETVEAVPLPDEIAAGVAAFVEAFHVERPFLKRERDRADPDALGRRQGKGRRAGEEE
jgi:uncharacterized protein DUF3305